MNRAKKSKDNHRANAAQRVSLDLHLARGLNGVIEEGK
jgi:hypothetical protein